MEIKEVKAYPLSVDRPGVKSEKPDHYLPYWRELSRAGIRSKFHACIVKIKTDEDMTGYGESIVREVPEAHAKIVERLFKKILINRDPTEIRELWDIMFASLQTRGHYGGYFLEALSGVDLALWDLAGKIKDAPVYKLLGGPKRDKIKAYASSIYWHYLGDETTESAAKETRSLVNSGHDQVKVKVGMGKMGAKKGADLELLKTIREEVGDRIEIMVDANSAFSLKEAKTLGREMEKLDIRWFEEPLPPHKNKEYTKLAKSLKLPVAGGESLFSRYTFKDFIENKGFDIVQPDICRCGGITEFLRITEMCKKQGLKIAPHVGLSGPGARAAALNCSAALSDDMFLTYEFMYKQDNPLASELVARQIEKFEDGHMKLPEGPGLGIQPDENVLQKFNP